MFNSLIPQDTQRKVSVFVGNRFLGTAKIKEIIHEGGTFNVLAGANWIWPSRSPDDSEKLLYLLESCLFPNLEDNLTGETTFKGRNVSWKVRTE
jgi:hypothetical protein